METNIINQLINLIDNVDVLKSIESNVTERIHELQIKNVKSKIENFNIEKFIKLSIEKENDPIIKEKLTNLINFDDYRNDMGLVNFVTQEEIENNGKSN
jgi:hypothetical protein